MKNGKNLTVIIGLGKTGISCIHYLTKKGSNIAVVDSREKPPFLAELKNNFPNIPYFVGNLNSPILDEADELIVSPGISLREPALLKQIKRGIKISGDIELFANAVKAPIIAITGSNGKSTVTTLVGEMAKNAGLQTQVGGNLGIPVLELINDEADLYVLELSSFQLETTHSLKAKAATILNISEDHMDRYRDLSEYAAAKHRIFMNCETAIINNDEPMTYENIKLPPKIITFGLNNHLKNDFAFANGFLIHDHKKLLKNTDLKIRGLHQVSNALAALALGSAINLNEEVMIKTLKEFEGLPHRCQFVATRNGVTWYNDSKGTNVGATRAAIDGLGSDITGQLILIAGGLGKDADFSSLKEPIEKFVKSVILIGKDAKKIEQVLKKCCKITHAASLEEAVKIASHEAMPGDAVLLSPACASFDMFNNFEHRGEVFIKAVYELIKDTRY